MVHPKHLLMEETGIFQQSYKSVLWLCLGGRTILTEYSMEVWASQRGQEQLKWRNLFLEKEHVCARKTEPVRCTRKGDIRRHWLMRMWGVSKSNICQPGWRAGGPEENWRVPRSSGHLISSPSGSCSLFSCHFQLTGWTLSTRWRAICVTQRSTEWSVTLA